MTSYYDIILDLEVDVHNTQGDPTPYNSSNVLSAIGYKRVGSDNPEVTIVWPDDLEGYEKLKETLAGARYIVAHNAKFDLSWLREARIDTTGETKVICTMINEYILNRGVRGKLSLDHLTQKYDTDTKKLGTLKAAINAGKNFSDLPKDVGEAYLTSDVLGTEQVYLEQLKRFSEEDSESLVPIRDLMAEFCSVLTDIERAGMAIDMKALGKVDQDYAKEQEELTSFLRKGVAEIMGDTPVNLSSPEQLSEVVYSIKLVDKNAWKDLMNIGVDDKGKPKRRPRMSQEEFKTAINKCFRRSYKTIATKCSSCHGHGYYYKTKKDGSNFKNSTKCPHCQGTGFIYQPTKDKAGLGVSVSLALASAGGFKTDKITINEIMDKVRSQKGKDFLNSIVRLSAIETYRGSFIQGIVKGIKSDGLLHANFNQCVAATGRLSSSNPNMQNFPKGRLFPVRLAFVSRFKDGKLIEVDYSQQEFRVAGILAKDARIKKEVESGFDVHSYTAKVLTDAGEPTERNPAKPYTFKPLYGGNSGTHAQREYFKEFFNKYQQVFQWHEQLQTEAVRDKRVTTATGRQFDFPGCHRNSWNGNANLKTQIVNYPVQSVATADLVPLGVIILHKEIKKLGLKSLVINTVHDSVLVDTHPDEIEIIKELAPKCLLAIKDESKRRFPNLDMDYIPLAVEGTIGDNWMNQEDF